MRQHPPRTSGAQQVEDPIEEFAPEVFTEKQRNTPSLQGLSRIVMRSSAYTPPT
jgi:hypothetical protein